MEAALLQIQQVERGTALDSQTVNRAIRKKPDNYLYLLDEFHITPTFWTSSEYLRALDIEEIHFGSSVWLEEDGKCLFPPIHLNGWSQLDVDYIWAIAPDQSKWIKEEEKKFLDWEYLYNTTKFLQMDGKSWSVFRKNSRKWKRNNQNSKVAYVTLRYNTEDLRRQLLDVFVQWIVGIRSEEDTIEDSDSIISYLEKGCGNYDVLLRDGEIVGFNAWDYSWKYINFRYSFYLPNEPFISEFLRLQFYLNIPNGVLVNDGGSLGNTNLEKFKDKLQPLEKNLIYTKEVPKD